MSLENARRPDISVLIPLYNKEDHVLACVESCLTAQLGSMELLVIDDCSTDASVEQIAHFTLMDPRVRLIRNEKNMGLYKTRLRLLDEARGRYVLYLDADDTLVPNVLQTLLMAARHDNVPVVKGWAYTENENEVFLGQTECRHARNIRQTSFATEQSLWYHLGSMSLYLYERDFLRTQVNLPADIPFMGEDTAINSFALPKASAISLVTNPIYTLNRTYETGSATSAELGRFYEIVSNQTVARDNLEQVPVAQAHLLQAQLRRRVSELSVIARSHRYADCADLLGKYQALYADIDILRYRPGNELVGQFRDAMPNARDREIAILLRYGSTRDLYTFMHDPQDPSARTVINRIKQAWTHLTSFDHVKVSSDIRRCSRHGTDLGKCAAALEAPARDEVLENPLDTCEFAQIKALLVRLRRRDRIEESWPEFQKLVAKNTGTLTAALNSRWLLSIVETFADFGTPQERHAAVMVSLIMNMEKTYRTLDKVYCRTRTPVPRTDGIKISAFDPEVAKGEKPLDELWDGVVVAAGDDNEDYMINVFRRIGREISEAPGISQICATLLERIFAEQESSLSLLDQYILRYSIRNELVSSIKHGEHRQAAEDNLIIGYLNREIRELRKTVNQLQKH